MSNLNTAWKKMVKTMKDAKDKLRASQQSQNSMSSVFSEFLQNRGLGNKEEQEGAADFFRQQIDKYEADVEKRRQKMLEQAVTHVAAVVGPKKAAAKKLAVTDDVLPYMPKKIDWATIAKQLQEAKKIAMMKKDGKPIPAVAHKTPAAKPSAKVIDESSGGQKSSQTKTSSSSDSSSSSSSSSSTTPNDAAQESPSKDSLSEKSEETAGRLTNIITQIVEDAKNPEKAKQHEKELQGMTVAELIRCSREDPDKFEQVIGENTKDSLFLCQPTPDEQKAWLSGKPVRQAKITHPFNLENAAVETRVFCVSCRPRHPDYPFTKKPK